MDCGTPKLEGWRAGETGFVREKEAFGHLRPDSLYIDIDIRLLSLRCWANLEPILWSLGARITFDLI